MDFKVGERNILVDTAIVLYTENAEFMQQTNSTTHQWCLPLTLSF